MQVVSKARTLVEILDSGVNHPPNKPDYIPLEVLSRLTPLISATTDNNVIHLRLRTRCVEFRRETRNQTVIPLLGPSPSSGPFRSICKRQRMFYLKRLFSVYNVELIEV
jgi:hypothetical protein